MSMLQIHAAAIAANSATYHVFLSRYSKRKKVVYGFVEGKEDPSFYRGFIEATLPPDWSVELWAAGSKDQVYRTLGQFDWRRFPKARVCFFVDLDLSGLIPERRPQETNVYVTDGYSIENSIVNAATCRRVLTEVCGLSGVNHAEVDRLCALFDAQLEGFLTSLVSIMAWILVWRRSRATANLQDIRMQDLYSMQAGKWRCKPIPHSSGDLTTYIHERCGVSIDSTVAIATVESEFLSGHRYRKLVRGKYVLWFLVEFCKSIMDNATLLCKSLKGKPKMSVSLGSSNAVMIVAPRARVPQSLVAFLTANYVAYVASRTV